ncbi:MAG: hypothetical protein ACI92G_002682 [Candidatus Pelagisphaera sp.]|jgi:uncharacterized protein YheU (UPF0270 family)
MEIPYQKFEAKILRAVIVEFVTREGTDYGDQVFPSMKKLRQLNVS